MSDAASLSNSASSTSTSTLISDSSPSSSSSSSSSTPASTSSTSTSESSTSRNDAIDKDTIPTDNKAYKRRDYWESRFAKEQHYDWIAGYDKVAHLIASHIKYTDRILMVGCGNSDLSSAMYNAGYHNITNIDFSETVIAKQSEKHKEMKEMTWHVMDMTALTFPDASFDIVLDKCAMDALLVDEGDPWDPDEAVREQVDRMCRSIIRVLTPTGAFVQISFGQPHFRRPNYLEKEAYHWDVSDTTFGEQIGFGYFFYVCRKKGPTNTSSNEDKS